MRPSVRVFEGVPVVSDDAIQASRRQLVSRKRDVELVFGQPMAAGSVVAAIVAVVNPPELIECIQQLNSRKFFISFKTAASAEGFHRVVAPSLRVEGAAPISKWLGAERRKIRVAFLPHAVANSELAEELKRYGRILDISDETYADTPVRIKTGTRIVEMEMISPVPNIITVCGFSVPVTYKGVVLQCRRCLLTGHLKADCATPFCDRCKAFGHSAELCKAPCLKCKAPDHHWKDCSVRSYAFAAASSGLSAVPTVLPTAEPDQGTLVTVSAEPGTDEMQVQQNSSPVAESSMSDITIEEYDSATEHNSETGAGVACQDQTNKEEREADDYSKMRGNKTCKDAEEPTCSGPWESAKLRNKKRKNVSITPDKLPDAKKAASGATQHANG